MNINFIAQPQKQLGVMLQATLDSPPAPKHITIVTAFASLQTVLRLKQQLHNLHEDGSTIRLVLGVDMGGTSKEVLKELATWPVEVFVFKNRKSGVTFHPKIYIVEAPYSAEIFLGSNNLTDGGLYGNYEGAVHVVYELPDDAAELDKAKDQLKKFIQPTAPVGRKLDSDYLKLLLTRGDIPTDAESRRRRKLARGDSAGTETGNGAAVDIFGFESTVGPPQLPIEVQQVVMAAVRHQLDELEAAKKKALKEQKSAKKKLKTVAAEAGVTVASPEPELEVDILNFTPLAQISPIAFYLELTKTTGLSGNIPGEQRIPLEAINVAQEFWGWTDNYVESINPRKGNAAGGKDRVYLSWKPSWRVRSINDPTKDVIKDVRMYFYKNSSDFRFYSGDLVNWAKAGDLVRITRCDNEKYVYECALAVAGTPEHAEWKAHCIPGSIHSPRVFGFS